MLPKTSRHQIGSRARPPLSAVVPALKRRSALHPCGLRVAGKVTRTRLRGSPSSPTAWVEDTPKVRVLLRGEIQPSLFHMARTIARDEGNLTPSPHICDRWFQFVRSIFHTILSYDIFLRCDRLVRAFEKECNHDAPSAAGTRRSTSV